MRKLKPIEIKYHYVGDDSPEAKKESERIVDEFFDKLFSKIIQEAKRKKQLQGKK